MAAVHHALQRIDVQTCLFPGLARQGLGQRVGGRDHAAHQRVPQARVVGFVERPLLHPHAPVGRQAHQVHGAGGDAQHTHGTPLHGAHDFAAGVGHRQLLVTPRATQVGVAQRFGQGVQGIGGGVDVGIRGRLGRQVQTPCRGAAMLTH
ncbi:hypothetical protein D3C72_1938030 [compost metagenome]